MVFGFASHATLTSPPCPHTCTSFLATHPFNLFWKKRRGGGGGGGQIINQSLHVADKTNVVLMTVKYFWIVKRAVSKKKKKEKEKRIVYRA